MAVRRKKASVPAAKPGPEAVRPSPSPSPDPAPAPVPAPTRDFAPENGAAAPESNGSGALKAGAPLAPLAASVGADAKVVGPVTVGSVADAAGALSRSPAPKKYPAEVEVELICGRLVDVPSPVAVVGRFQGLPLQGTAAEIDDRLNSWVKRAFEYGIASARLGELTYLPLGHIRPRPIAARNVLVAGMGDPGHFTRADLQYLYMNIFCAVAAPNLGGFSDTLANAPRYGLKLDRVLRSVFDGALDAFERLVCSEPSPCVTGDPRPVKLILVEPNPGQYDLLSETLKTIERQCCGPAYDRHGVSLRVRVVRRVPPALSLRPHPSDDLGDSAADTRPDTPVVRFTISSQQRPGAPAYPGLAADDVAAFGAGAGGEGATSPARAFPKRQIFQCTAVTDSATIPVREKVVEPYFVSRIPEKLVNARTLRDQEKFGLLLASYLLPDDFLKLLDPDAPADERASLTLILDHSTALFPWEMAAVRSNRAAQFFGSDFQLTRQFRTLLSDAPGVPPPLNSKLEALVIADPAGGRLALPGAEAEGLAVVRALCLAQQVWGDQLSLNLTLRLGSPDGRDPGALRDLLRSEVPGISDAIVDEAAPCDPTEILALLTTREHDVVHYAGHGVFDPTTDREGWVFNEECTLTAKDIIQMRKVPRLVFANACLSSAIEASEIPLPALAVQQVSLAEAFFARGVENYIGAGWKVDDHLAVDFAVRFYLQALGVGIRPEGRFEVDGLAPPATLGEAVSGARRALLETIRNEATSGPSATIWAAYQHYGQANSKLLPFTNVDVEQTRRRSN